MYILYTYIYMYIILYILHIIYYVYIIYIYIWYRHIRYALMTSTSPRRSPCAPSFFFALREFLHGRNYSADGQQDQPYGAMSGAHHGRNGGPGLQKSYSYLEPNIPGWKRRLRVARPDPIWSRFWGNARIGVIILRVVPSGKLT